MFSGRGMFSKEFVVQVAELQMKTEREKQELIEKYHNEIEELQKVQDEDRVSYNQLYIMYYNGLEQMWLTTHIMKVFLVIVLVIYVL